VRLRSRRNNSFNRHYPLIAEALGDFPEDTVVDGEVVALDGSGFPNFSLLQNYRSEASRIHFFAFDLLVHQGRDIARLPLIERRSILRSAVNFNSGRVRITDYIEASSTDILHAVRQQGLEGLIGKRKDSRYEPGKRSGAGSSTANRGQELVIGGYIPESHGLEVRRTTRGQGPKESYKGAQRRKLKLSELFSRNDPMLAAKLPISHKPGLVRDVARSSSFVENLLDSLPATVRTSQWD